MPAADAESVRRRAFILIVPLLKKNMKSASFCLLFALACLLMGATATEVHAQADNASFDREVRVHFSLYYENWKNKNWQDAVQNLNWILYNAPGYPRNRDSNFDRAIDIYEALANDASDPEQKRVWLDSTLSIFDRVIPILQAIDAEIDPFVWKRNKGRFIQTHIAHLDDVKHEAFQAYRDAYDIDPHRINPYYLDVLINDLYQSGDIGGALDFLRELKDIRGEEPEIDNLVRKYFVVIPPDEQIAFLEEQHNANPDDPEVIVQLFELYQQEAYRAEMLALASKVLALEPSASTLRLLMRMYVEDGDNERAIELFEQLSSLPDVELMAQDYYNLGMAYQDQEEYRAARDYYRQAVDTDADFTPAARAIPDLYSTVVARCGVADREQAAVFWLIADAYARIGDNAGAARMATAFPTAEDVFYVSRWSNGESTQVSYSCQGLTISGTTTVRQR